MECYDGFIFVDGTTTNMTECVLIDGVAKWSFVEQCYPSNYFTLFVSIGELSYSKTTVNGIYPLLLKKSFNLHITKNPIF